MDPHSELRLAQVIPRLSALIHQLADTLATQGITILVVQGLRTVEQQDALYARGRTTPGSIVTNAKGGYSWHQFGCAIDAAPMNRDDTVDWNSSHPQWHAMESLGVAVGLTSGATWIRLVDAPHLQYTGRFPVGAPTDEVRALYEKGGLQAVWDEIVPPAATQATQVSA